MDVDSEVVVTELYGGVRKTFETDTPGFRPYVGGGLSLVSARLAALSPLATLSRGYAVPLDDEGMVLRRGSMFEVGRDFDLRVVDATIRCEVREIGDIEVRVEDQWTTQT